MFRSRFAWSALFAFGLLAIVSAQAAKDAQGVKDPELFSRMPNYFLLTPGAVEEREFDAHNFTVFENKRPQRVRIEGRLRRYRYTLDRKLAIKPSPLQIQRNYQQAAQKLGGKVLWEEPSGYCRTTLQVARDGKEIWVEVYPMNTGNIYDLIIVEREAMKQDVVANAAALEAGLGSTGHVEVPGILFDTNQSGSSPSPRRRWAKWPSC